jgi:hypothetical protein
VIRVPGATNCASISRRREIETAIYNPLGLHEKECFDYVDYKLGAFPEAEQAARESPTMPVHPENFE